MPSPYLPITPATPWLAPLAGYSDLPFRLLCRKFGCSVAVTEMVSAKGLCYGGPGTENLLQTSPEDTPLVIQLFGDDPVIIKDAMQILMEQGFLYFDFNAGCPVRKVIKTGAGAAMAKTPELLARIARDMAELAPGRTGVKMRRGWTAGEDNYLTVGKALEEAGAAWVSLHPRTARQGYSGEADWLCLKKLKKSISIPVIASGDLFSAGKAQECITQTGVDAVMFARGALYDPQIFKDFLCLLKGIPASPRSTLELAATINSHIDFAEKSLPQKRVLLKMRGIIPRYVRHTAGAKALRSHIVRCTSLEELKSLVLHFLQNK